MKRKPSPKTATSTLKVSIQVSPSSVRLVPPTSLSQWWASHCL